MSFTMRIFPFLLQFIYLQTGVLAFSSASPSKVVVTGASGKTGRLVFEALLENPKFDPKALVRSEKSGKSLKKAVPATRLDQIVVCDITELDTTDQGGSIPSGLEGSEAMVICTSAMPTLSKMSLLKALLKAPFNIIRRKKALDFRSLKFVWKKGQYPEKVDYEGQVALIEMAKKLGISHIVVVGSMGGTDPNNFLNSVGKNADGSGNGDILLWKRRAEKHLVESGLDYTIIHPGGLRDTPAGQEEIVIDVNDKLLNNTQHRSISRGDVANLCVAALSVGKPQKVAFDCVTKPAEEGVSVKTAQEAVKQFLHENKVYDYAL